MEIKVKPNMTINSAIKQIEKRLIAVGKERDKLDQLISELEHLKWNCEEAHENLQRARDSLSELV